MDSLRESKEVRLKEGETAIMLFSPPKPTFFQRILESIIRFIKKQPVSREKNVVLSIKIICTGIAGRGNKKNETLSHSLSRAERRRIKRKKGMHFELPAAREPRGRKHPLHERRSLARSLKTAGKRNQTSKRSNGIGKPRNRI